MFKSCIAYHVSAYERFLFLLFFFFQAEDGIRDLTVTGVQTCALPISRDSRERERCDRGAGCSDCRSAQEASAAPILRRFLECEIGRCVRALQLIGDPKRAADARDRKSTRLNSSHSQTSYAGCCSKTRR